jgi:PAS domain S-box-containing protein
MFSRLPTPTLEQFYIESRHFRPSSFNAYLLSAALVTAALLLRVSLSNWLPGTQFITLLPAIMAATLICGMAAGFFATLLALLSAWFFVLPPIFSFELQGSSDAVGLLIFVMVGCTEVVVVGAMREAIYKVRGLNNSLATVFEANPDATIVINQGGQIIAVNQRATELFGVQRADLIGAPIERFLPDRPRDSSRQSSMEREMQTGEGPQGIGRRSDKSEFPADIRGGTIKLDGELAAIRTVRDLTQQNALTQALAESRRQQAILEERQRSAEEMRLWADAFQCASIGIEISDPEKAKVRFVNPAFAAAHGISAEQAQGMSILDLYAEPERRRLPALLEKADAVGQINFESVHVRKDGSVFPVEINITSKRDSSGALIYRLTSARDVTSTKKTEAALRQAQKMEAIGNITGGMAHDFNNLLAVIIGNLDMVEDVAAESAERASVLVGEARDAARRGAELTRSLLAFSRRQALRPTRIDLNELATGMSTLLVRVLGEDIEITLDLAQDLWPVVADAAQVEASIVNLATNARDAMPKGGKLTISSVNRHLDAGYSVLHPSVAPGEYAMIAVSDNGIGMTQEVQNQIFEPFFTTKELGKGTGLGLSMVFGFANQSAGHVNAYSEVGIGTTIRLYLPRDQAARSATAPTLRSTIAASGHGEKVLVVEDNVALRRVVKMQLGSLNYGVIETDNARSAIAVLETQHVDLLFSDVIMPGGMDGFELASLALQRWPSLKVILTSGFSSLGSDKAPTGAAAALPILSKPYRRIDLALALRKALGH